MDARVMGASLGMGLATGITTMLGLTVVFLPVSYVMNRFVYHVPSMRFLIALLTGAFSIFSFIAIMIMFLTGSWGKVHYFGLMPFVNAFSGVPEGYFASFFRLINAVLHPFMLFFDAEGDEAGYKNTVREAIRLIEPEEGVVPPEFEGEPVFKDAVSEAFFKEARGAGAIDDRAAWAAKVESLSEIGKYIFTK